MRLKLTPGKSAKRLALMWVVLVVLFCLTGALCRGEGAAVPAEVEIQWPDAAPFDIGEQPAKPDGKPGDEPSDKKGE